MGAKEVNNVVWQIIRVGLMGLATWLAYKSTQIGGMLGLAINKGDSVIGGGMLVTSKGVVMNGTELHGTAALLPIIGAAGVGLLKWVLGNYGKTLPSWLTPILGVLVTALSAAVGDAAGLPMTVEQGVLLGGFTPLVREVYRGIVPGEVKEG